MPEDGMMSVLKRLWKEESGQDLTEYALLLVLITLLSVASVNTLADAVSNLWSRAASTIAAQ